MTPKLFLRTIVGTAVACLCLTLLLARPGHEPKLSTAAQPFCTILPSSWAFKKARDKDQSLRKSKKAKDSALFTGAGRAFYWNKKQTLRIYFHNGLVKGRNRVLAVANEWASRSGLTFQEVPGAASAEIRISFSCTGYSSLVGKESLDNAYTGKPTMCLEGLDKTSDEVLFKRTVLHEFGHAMGLYHELQNPNTKIAWDTAALYHYYDSVYHWKPDSVNKWVLRLHDPANVDASDFDPHSIMLYAVPRSVTKDGFQIQWPDRLSQKDIRFINTYYR